MKFNLLFMLLSIVVFTQCSSAKKTIEKEINSDFIKINDLYWNKYELTNGEYKQFLVSLDKGSRAFEACKINNQNWLEMYEDENLGISMSRNYDKVPFDKYPVVNITAEAAKQYCQWLTNKAKKANVSFRYRLPKKNEFEALFELLSIKLAVQDTQFDSLYRSISIAEDAKIPAPARDIDRTVMEGFNYNKYDLYHITDNVSEYMSNGKIIGGNWSANSIDSVRILEVLSPSPTIGFRVVAEEL